MFNTGIVYKTKQLIDEVRYKEINYIPKKIVTPSKLVKSKSQAWVGLEKIILEIIEFSKIDRGTALEFGVEFGYSTAIWSNDKIEWWYRQNVFLVAKTRPSKPVMNLVHPGCFSHNLGILQRYHRGHHQR